MFNERQASTSGPCADVGADALTPHGWAIPTPTAADTAERLADLRDAIGSQRLEGRTPSPTVVAQLERIARGEQTIAAVVADIHARIARGAL